MTHLLRAWRDGDSAASEELLPLVYNELKRLAQWRMRRERADHVLQTTALVHEAYVRLARRQLDWKDRQHFFYIAAKLMRQVLVEFARRRNAKKRGGGQLTVQLNEDLEGGSHSSDELLSLNAALEELSELDPDAARVIDLRYFSGMTIVEVADVLGVSRSKVQKDQRFALAWLRQRLDWKGV